MFGKEKSASISTRSREADQWAQAREYTKVLDAMAAEEEAKLRAEHPDLLQQFEDEHRKQSAGFSYEFRRHGDFLTVYLTRAANSKSEWGNEAQQQFTETVNLGKVESIALVEGHLPDANGSFGWHLQSVGVDEDGKETSWGSSSGRPCGPPGNGYKHKVFPAGRATYIPSARPFIAEPDRSERSHGMHMSMNDGVDYYTQDFPRQAEDDAVLLKGLGYRIFAPTGLGQAMLDAMLAEIARGALPIEPA